MTRGTITELRQAARGSKRRLVFVDGEPWCATPIEVVRATGLAVGQDRDLRDLEQDMTGAARTCGRERALRLLAFRDRTVAELRSRLADDGYGDEVTDEVVDELRASGLLDDRRTAESVARVLARDRGLGRRRLAADLAHRGVDDLLAREIVDAACPQESETARASALAATLVRTGRGRDERHLAAALVRKGFSVRDSFAAAKRALDGPTD